jgi:superfamily II DNA or RNA helicase
LVLAHREELLNQAAEKFQAINRGISVGIEQGQRKCEGSQIVIASVQTMQRKRLESFNPDQFDVIICDEAHHSVAKSYTRVFDHFGVSHEGTEKILIGVTATPNRGDDVGLSTVYDDIAYEYPLFDGIKDGWLCNIIGKKIHTETSLDGIKNRAGDFAVGALADAVDSPQRNQLVVQKQQEMALSRKTLVFSVNFLDAKVESGIVTGETPKGERQDILSRFFEGKLRVLCNCGVLTEGFDDPEVSCIVMARPTQSPSLYTQIIGRGSRLKKGEIKDCLVLDFTDNCDKHSVMDYPSLFGLPPEFLSEGDPIEEKKEIDEYALEHPWIDLSQLKSIKQLEAIETDINFFRSAPPAGINKFTHFQWMQIDGGYRLAIPGNQALEIKPTRLDSFNIWGVAGRNRQFLNERKKLGEAVKYADQWVKKARKGSIDLIDLRKSWRGKEMTVKQEMHLRKIGAVYPKSINRGQAASIIALSIEKRKV